MLRDHPAVLSSTGKLSRRAIFAGIGNWQLHRW